VVIAFFGKLYAFCSRIGGQIACGGFLLNDISLRLCLFFFACFLF
jgi:hypothetical protein